MKPYRLHKVGFSLMVSKWLVKPFCIWLSRYLLSGFGEPHMGLALAYTICVK